MGCGPRAGGRRFEAMTPGPFTRGCMSVDLFRKRFLRVVESTPSVAPPGCSCNTVSRCPAGIVVLPARSVGDTLSGALNPCQWHDQVDQHGWSARSGVVFQNAKTLVRVPEVVSLLKSGRFLFRVLERGRLLTVSSRIPRGLNILPLGGLLAYFSTRTAAGDGASPRPGSSLGAHIHRT